MNREIGIAPWPRLVLSWSALLAALAAATLMAQSTVFGTMRYSVFIFFTSLIAWRYGFRHALAMTVLSAAALDYFFLAPTGSLLIESPVESRALGAFVLMGVAVGRLASVSLAPVDTRRPVPTRPLYPLPYAQGLERSAQCFEALCELPGGFATCTLDRDGRITRWSVSASERTGYAAERVLGRSLADLSKTDPQRVGTALRAAASDGCSELSVVLDQEAPLRNPLRTRIFPIWQAAVASAPRESATSEGDEPVELGGYLVVLGTA